MEDALLIKLLRESSDDGIEKLLELYSDSVYSIVKNRLQSVANPTDIEECVSEVFSDFYIGLDNYDPSRANIKTYLYSIANHKATDLFRKRIKRVNHISFDDEELLVNYPLDDENSPDAALIREEIRKELYDAILSLPEPDKTIIILKYYYGESAKMIGEKLGMKEPTVATRAFRGIKKLREILGITKK